MQYRIVHPIAIGSGHLSVKEGWKMNLPSAATFSRAQPSAFHREWRLNSKLRFLFTVSGSCDSGNEPCHVTRRSTIVSSLVFALCNKYESLVYELSCFAARNWGNAVNFDVIRDRLVFETHRPPIVPLIITAKEVLAVSLFPCSILSFSNRFCAAL